MFDVRYLKEMAHGYGYGFLAIDNFTRYMWIIPIENKETPERLRAMGEIIKVMGKPTQIYSDYEPGMEQSIEFPNGWKNIIFYTMPQEATPIRPNVLSGHLKIC